MRLQKWDHVNGKMFLGYPSCLHAFREETQHTCAGLAPLRVSGPLVLTVFFYARPGEGWVRPPASAKTTQRLERGRFPAGIRALLPRSGYACASPCNHRNCQSNVPQLPETCSPTPWKAPNFLSSGGLCGPR